MLSSFPMKAFSMQSVSELAFPEKFDEVTLDSPATEVFTDFKQYQPRIIESSTSISDAEKIMKRCHVRLMLVIDETESFKGTLSYLDIVGEKSISLINRDRHKEDISVAEIMTKKEDLKAIALADIEKVNVKSLIETLRHEGVQHYLVVNYASNRIRGVISASDLARRLHIPLEIHKVPTFTDIYKTLHARL